MHPWLVYAGLAAITIVVYSAVHDFEFVDYDDIDYIRSNPHVAAGLTWAGIRWALTAGYLANWHPLTWMSHMLDVQLFGMNAGRHHVVSLLLHVLNTVLLFGVLRRMTGSTNRSLFVAALFGVHPLHVESVAWAAERKDVLSTLFLMLALWAYCGYVRRPAMRSYLPVALLFGLGLMAKPMLVTLPLLLLLFDVWPLRRRLARALLIEKIPLFALATASAVVTVIVQRGGGAVVRLDQVPLGLRLANVPLAYVHYIGKMFWPVHLVAMYPLPQSVNILHVVLALGLLAVISALAIYYRRPRPYLIVGWLWFLVALVPVIGIVQVGAQASADRYTYVPLIGLSVMLAWGIPDAFAPWARSVTVLRFVGCFVIASCAVLTALQVRYWRDSLALWQHAVDAMPDNYFAHESLGYVYWKRGNADEALRHYYISLRLRPDFAETHNNIGVALAGRGQLKTAVSYFRDAIRLKPGFAAARDNLNATLARIQTLDAQLAAYREDVRTRPGDIRVRNELGAALAAEGRVDEAIEQFMAALRIDSTQADVHFNLGVMFERQGTPAAAAEAFATALRYNPGHAAARSELAALSARSSASRQK
jgi:Tfp pilus assembly protein PilF